MTITYCLRISVPIALCCTIYVACAQRHFKVLPRQKGAATDSIFRSKIDSRLLQVLAQSPKQRNVRLETPKPVDVGADSTGNLPVDISAIVTDSLLTLITTLGGKIIYPSKEYRTIRATVPLSAIKTIAACKEVTFIQPAVPAYNNGISKPRL